MSESEGSDPVRSPLVPESDEKLLAACRIDTFRAGGKGGQHQNTTESGVRLTHRPSGLVASARDERSQHRNKAIALERLREALRARRTKPKKRKRTRVPRHEKRARLEEKRKTSRTKELRKPPKTE